MKTMWKDVDGMVVTVVESMPGTNFVKEPQAFASVLIQKLMSAKPRMEIHAKCHLRTKARPTIGVPELTADQIGVTIILRVRNGAIVT